jgi:hypothetical protein
MNVHDEMSDNEVMRAAADSLSAIQVSQPPDVRAVMTRGRTRQRRRLTGLGLAGTAAALGIAGVFGIFGGGPAMTHPAGTIRTAAFTLVENANGTATLTLTQSQVFNPSALKQALAQDGIPVLIKTGTFCSSHPAPPSSGVVTVELPNGTPVQKSTLGHSHPVPSDAVTVINPAAMPAGTELFFDYVHGGLTGDLIYTNSYTCSD